MFPHLWINIQVEDITSQQTREGMLRRYFSVVFIGIQTLLIMFVASLLAYPLSLHTNSVRT